MKGKRKIAGGKRKPIIINTVKTLFSFDTPEREKKKTKTSFGKTKCGNAQNICRTWRRRGVDDISKRQRGLSANTEK